jgi:hypothetical protein
MYRPRRQETPITCVVPAPCGVSSPHPHAPPVSCKFLSRVSSISTTRGTGPHPTIDLSPSLLLSFAPRSVIVSTLSFSSPPPPFFFFVHLDLVSYLHSLYTHSYNLNALSFPTAPLVKNEVLCFRDFGPGCSRLRRPLEPSRRVRFGERPGRNCFKQ